MAEANLNEEVKNELNEIDARIEELNAKIRLADDLEELHKDERFIRVMIDGYFGTEAHRVFELLTTPTPLKRDQIENIEDKLSAIRNVKQYYQTILINARTAPEQIEEERQYRLEITARHSLDNAGSEDKGE